MINILVPLAGRETYGISKSNSFPLILTEIEGELLLQKAAKPFLELNQSKRIVAAVPSSQIKKYSLDKVLKLLGSDVFACPINEDTQGSVCSALLAIETLDLESPLIITSFEQVLDFDINSIVSELLESDIDSAVMTFESIHPKWSFVKTTSDNKVVEAAEKRPISNKAVAGFYYFKTGNLFVQSAMDMIRKDVKHEGRFYISQCLNEVILNEGKVLAYEIDKTKYFHVNDKHSFNLYENKLIEETHKIKADIITNTRHYIDFFNNKDIESLNSLMDDSFSLTDPNTQLEGKDKALKYINDLFSQSKSLYFKPINISASSTYQSFIEFELSIDGRIFIGIDSISWSKQHKMRSMNAYLYEKTNE